ncbi:flagellar motor switch protein FliG [Seohaeicola zhoushanensis]|uniref:Flagellar motor switch protein FliG n=1 Tax=Seohaeicola zhoushanensis TaxID=1569283 RepID=A0A8J3GX48_9RHOB|nr:flagellar motor switch protein FliG [Seohaeicola zhoushanensis]
MAKLPAMPAVPMNLGGGGLPSGLPAPRAPLPSGGAPPAAGVKVPRPLDMRAKAAIIVRLLLNEGADIPLEELPDDLQAQLTQQMGRMGLVDRVTLDAVVAEFADALESVGLSFPNGLAGALDALDGKISPQTAARLRKEAGVRQLGDPWTRLRDMEVERLLPFFEAESTEVAAVLLSKLDTAKAAQVLAKLPGPLARRVTYAMSLTASVTPEAVDRIGLSLAAQLDDQPPRAFKTAPGARVGAILNQSAARTRDDMLTSLDETDATFAGEVRREIFTFAHISIRVSPRDVPAVIRAIDPDTLVTAMAGATDDTTSGVVDFLLSNMSGRMADNLREEVDDRGKVRPRDAEAAMNAIVGAIRDLAETGAIELLNPDERFEEEQ